MELSVIIPAYNESARLPRTLQRISRYLNERQLAAEIVVVDDGSTDETSAVARAVPGVRLIIHPHNLGKGAAVRTGMLAARGVWRLLCDADLSTPIEELERLQSGPEPADIIIGSRRAPGAKVVRAQAKWKVFLGQAGNLLIQTLLVPGIQDTQCGFKLFHERTREIFTLQRLQRFGYDFELLYLARRHHFRIREVPVTWANDEQSKVKPIDYLTTLVDIGRIHLNNWRGYYRLAARKHQE